jgi:hypothetical protein
VYQHRRVVRHLNVLIWATAAAMVVLLLVLLLFQADHHRARFWLVRKVSVVVGVHRHQRVSLNQRVSQKHDRPIQATIVAIKVLLVRLVLPLRWDGMRLVR